MKIYRYLFYISSILFLAGCSITPNVPLKLAQKQELEEVEIPQKSAEEIRERINSPAKNQA